MKRIIILLLVFFALANELHAQSLQGKLVIKQCYYTGSRTPANTNYFSDQFHEIYNNSPDTVYVDSLCIADAFGVSGQINPTTQPSEFQNDQNNVYVNSAAQTTLMHRLTIVNPSRIFSRLTLSTKRKQQALN